MPAKQVSMKSGLEDRNNNAASQASASLPVESQFSPAWKTGTIGENLYTLGGGLGVSMKSGLEDRNNHSFLPSSLYWRKVSMKSGLEDRNNWTEPISSPTRSTTVSMKSGLEDRNNRRRLRHRRHCRRLNEVRPGRPEQSAVVCQKGNNV